MDERQVEYHRALRRISVVNASGAQGGPGEWSGQRYASVVDLFYEDPMKNGELVEATNWGSHPYIG